MRTKLKTAVLAGTAAILVAGALASAAPQLFGQSNENLPAGQSRLPTGTNTPAVAMGADHGIILASDGSLWSWGENSLGWPVLGLGNVKAQSSLRRIGDESDWTQVTTSDSHVIALKSDGTIWGWGNNLSGQLGDGTSGRRATRKTVSPGPFGIDWKQVAAGGTSSYGLASNGTLWAWGNNWTGQLGIGTTTNSAEPVQVGSSTNWTKVWAAGIQTVAQQSDGSLWFWGSLTGEGKGANRFLVPTRVSADTNWADVCFGYFCVLAIKTDGTLWAWGRDAGIYTGAPVQRANVVPARVGTNSDWIACASAEYFYHLLRKKDRSLWALDASDYAYPDKTAHKPIEFKRIDLDKDLVVFGTTSRS